MESTSTPQRFQGTYSAEPSQVQHARRALARSLSGHPSADDAALIASEFATNAVLHSASGDGGWFTLRAEIYPGYVRVEVEDAGGPWNPARHDDGRPHGLDVTEAVTGPGNWGIDGDATGRVAWATIGAVNVAACPGQRLFLAAGHGGPERNAPAAIGDVSRRSHG
jgi:anti-sigma regulatory factor (Ser/Thr protein kinase)